MSRPELVVCNSDPQGSSAKRKSDLPSSGDIHKKAALGTTNDRSSLSTAPPSGVASQPGPTGCDAPATLLPSSSLLSPSTTGTPILNPSKRPRDAPDITPGQQAENVNASKSIDQATLKEAFAAFSSGPTWCVALDKPEGNAASAATVAVDSPAPACNVAAQRSSGSAAGPSTAGASLARQALILRTDIPAATASLEPIFKYNLDTDEVHKFRIRWQQAVQLVGVKRQYQLAREVAVYLWPHNAIKLGFQRWIPPAATDAILGGMLSVKFASIGRQAVWPGFMYTHPDLACEACIRTRRTCVFASWIGPHRADHVPPAQSTQEAQSASAPYMDACMSCHRGTDDLAERVGKCSVAGKILSGPATGQVIQFTPEVLRASEGRLKSWIDQSASAVRLAKPKRPVVGTSGTPRPASNPSTVPSDSSIRDMSNAMNESLKSFIEHKENRIEELETLVSTLSAEREQLEQRCAKTVEATQAAEAQRDAAVGAAAAGREAVERLEAEMKTSETLKAALQQRLEDAQRELNRAAHTHQQALEAETNRADKAEANLVRSEAESHDLFTHAQMWENQSGRDRASLDKALKHAAAQQRSLGRVLAEVRRLRQSNPEADVEVIDVSVSDNDD